MTELYQNKEWLYDQYWNKKKSESIIAKDCNCHRGTIQYYMKKYEIPHRSLSEAIKLNDNNKGRFKKGMIPWNKGKPNGVIPWNKGIEWNEMKGEKHPNWKGDQVTYSGIHEWIRRHKLKPILCEKCNKQSKRLELSNISGEYKRDINDFQYLCVPCHKKFDGTWDSFIEGGKATRFKKRGDER